MIEEHYREHFKTFSKRAGRALGDHHLGEDCTQEAYEMAIKYLPSFNAEKGNFEAWFQRIFMNSTKKYISFIRDKGMVKELKLTDLPIISPEMIVQHRFLLSKEIDLLDRSELAKESLYLYIVLGYRAQEVGDILNVSAMSVNKQVQRFKEHLMEKYGG